MNIFQLIKQVLDDAYGHIEETNSPRDNQVTHDLQVLSGKYKTLGAQYANIDYGEPSTRFAYVFRYVTAHAGLVYTIIRRSKSLIELFRKKDIEVACIGGGPGSDLLGIVKYLQGENWAGRLMVEIFDREAAWGETWTRLFKRFEADFTVNTSFQTFDILENGWKRFRGYLQADLFTMIFFASEVYGIRDQAKLFFDHMLSNAKKGALLLYIDNDADVFSNWFDALLDANGWEVLESGSGRITPPGDEQAVVLKDYIARFANPRLAAHVAWRVARKS
jgi:hypothetical protein